MSQRRAPWLRFSVMLLICALSAGALLAGCKQKPEGAAGGRLTLGGEEAADLAAEEEGGAGVQPAAPVEGEAVESVGAPAGPSGGRGGQGGRRGGRGGRMTAPAAPEAVGEAVPGGEQLVAEGEAEAKAGTGIPEVDEAEKVRDFAALYGPVTRLDEKDWDGRVLEWVVFTYDGGKRKLQGRTFKLPLSMVVDAPCAEILEGYFPIYGASPRPSGKTISTQIVTAPRRARLSSEEVKEIIRKSRPQVAAAEEGAAVAATSGGAAGAARGGMGGGRRGGMGRGGRGGRGMRGGR